MSERATSIEVENLNEITDIIPVGFEISAHDYIAYTYVATGNGAGEVETIVYKTGGSGGDTVATKTYAYDASNRVSSVTKT